jgi:hypothetical protein
MALPLERLHLHPPTISELVSCIESGMKKNFKESSVTVEHCPDLRQPPYNLAGSGLCGSTKIADIGGQPNLTPSPKLDKIYSFLDIIRLINMPKEHGFILGAGAGPFHILGHNSELMPNLSYEGDHVTNRTHYAKVLTDGEYSCEKIDASDCALMCNLFGCEGNPGPVLRIKANTRTGPLNFTDTIRDALREEFGERNISMGGVFLIKNGTAKLHIMPDFSSTPLVTNEEKVSWLKFYDMHAPIVCLSVFHSHDPGLALRIEHTHCFSDHGVGGHYHFDTTPETVEYEGYFNVAEVLYRIDRP